jgi:hypothetical protein
VAAKEGQDAQVKAARQTFNTARSSQWFQPVVTALRKLSGEGELCMYCSANEPSQVEHYRPLSVFPQHALEYSNFLWVCDICNRSYKGSRFPPDTEPGAQILNPLEDTVWEHFFLDEQFGRLLPKHDPLTDVPNARAESTRKVVGVDRENLQLRRKHRLRSLKRQATILLEEVRAKSATREEAQNLLQEWREECFQADVADYFLNGPGRAVEPFRELLSLLEDGTDPA